MGTWGPGNLENDGALDELTLRSKELIGTLMKRAATSTSREADEPDYETLFVEFEMVFALDAKKLLSSSAFPPPEVVETLKREFIADWDAYIDGLQPQEGFKKARRSTIVRTFNRFKRLCAKHQS